MLAAGESVDNRYIVEGVIGVGGTAVVYRVRHKVFDRVLALKVLSLTSPAIRRRMVREGQVQNKLNHPNVVAVTEIVPDIQGGPGLVMEYIAGPSLEQAMAQYKLTLEQALSLFHGVVAGVRHAHQHGAVHRDLKPANVLLEQTDAGYVPKVTDFGLAKLVRGEGPSVGQTRQGSVMGTPAYMAPEQILDAGTVDERADIFSLGCMLYELVTGQRAFPGKEAFPIYLAIQAGEYTPPRLHKPDLPDEVDVAIRGCLIVDRDRRIPDCDTLLKVLTGQSTWSLDDLDDLYLGAPLSQEISRTEEMEKRPELPVASRLPAGGTPAPVSARSQDPTTTYPLEGSPVDQSLVGDDDDDDDLYAHRRRSPWSYLVGGGLLLFVVGGAFALLVGWQVLVWTGVLGDEPDVAAAVDEPAPEEPAAPPAEEPPEEPAAAAPREVEHAEDEGPHGAFPDPAPRPAIPVTRERPPPEEPEEAAEPPPADVVTVKLLASPRTVDLKVDGRSEGRTPAKLDLKPGQHLVELSTGDASKQFPINVAPSGANKWCYSFETGEVYMDACPR